MKFCSVNPQFAMILCFENGAPNYLRVDGEGGGISENNKTLRRHVNKIDEK